MKTEKEIARAARLEPAEVRAAIEALDLSPEHADPYAGGSFCRHDERDIIAEAMEARKRPDARAARYATPPADPQDIAGRIMAAVVGHDGDTVGLADVADAYEAAQGRTLEQDAANIADKPSGAGPNWLAVKIKGYAIDGCRRAGKTLAEYAVAGGSI